MSSTYYFLPGSPSQYTYQGAPVGPFPGFNYLLSDGLVHNINNCTTQYFSVCKEVFFPRVDYIPTLAGNALFAAIFGILLLVQTGLGIKYKTWGFMAGMIGGLLLEAVGYAGRIMMHNNVFQKNSFLIYIICLTIGPAFLSSSIYLCLARIVVLYGEGLSRFSPRAYTLTFIGCDLVSLILQGTGGGLASTSNTPADTQTGVNVMIAGLAFQVVSLVLFSGLCAEFAWRVKKNQGAATTAFRDLRESAKFKAFLAALAAATLFIIVRSTFRVAELKDGFRGKLANEEITFMVLEGPMIILAVLALTVCHPGLSFGGLWRQVNFSFKGGRKDGKVVTESSSLEMGKNPHSVGVSSLRRPS